jgi:hypothetical protein
MPVKLPIGIDLITPHLHGLNRYMEESDKRVVIDYANIKEEYMTNDGFVDYHNKVYHIPLVIKHNNVAFKINLKIMKKILS